MNFDLFLSALLLGLIEGLTEFLPVSSTGHLILFGALLKFDNPGKVFEIAIQLGSILAIAVVYRRKLWDVAITLHQSRASQRFVTNIILAFTPAAVIGALAHGFIKEHLFIPSVVCACLIVGGILIILIERRMTKPRYHSLDDITPYLALKVGLVQTLGMIPGVSRAGATILGAELLGVERKVATEFSFFLALPTMLGATVYDLHKNWHQLSLDNFGLIGIGFVTAFVLGLLVVKTLLRYLNHHDFTVFGWYRIAIGSIMAWILVF